MPAEHDGDFPIAPTRDGRDDASEARGAAKVPAASSVDTRDIALEATAFPDRSEEPTLAPPTTGSGGAGLAGAARRVPGTTDRYVHGPRLGAGAMGEVNAARDELLGRDVAIKAMLSTTSPALTERFLREARIQGRLEHPSIVPVHDLGFDTKGRPYFVMKRLEGVTLRDVLLGAPGSERFTRRRLLEALVDVCQALELAHRRGVVHRDIKPSNIMLGEHGEVYVLDWGIARVQRESDGGWSEVVTLDGQGTRVGTVMGTPGFMAPEQARGLPVDGRADVYSLGATLFEVLAGEPFLPPGQLDPGATDTHPMRRANGQSVAPELDEVCARALAREPGDRWQSPRELGDAIQRYLDGDRDEARRKELANEHLAQARAALDAGDSAGAMAAAGRALALDPTSTAAASLVSRLMLEPPRELPAAVVEELAAHELNAVRREARRTIGTFAAYLLGLPLLLWHGVAQWWAIAAIYALVAIGMLDSFLMSKAVRVRPGRLWVSYLISVALIASISTVLGPFLIVPAMALAVVVFFGAIPHMQNALALGTIGALAVAGPWGLEAIGVVAPTVSVSGQELRIVSHVIPISAATTPMLLLLHSVSMLIVVAGVATGAAKSERRLREELAVRAWKLRQLLPESS